MEPDFWHSRWANDQIGFHADDVNLHLRNWWPSLAVPAGSTVFVPLCGKSRDMLWLREQGYPVIGVELSSIAVDAFVAENDLVATRTRHGAFTRYEAGGLVILCGDFFDLKPEDLAGVQCLYDRASLIALPPAMRSRYVSHLKTLLPAGTRALLVTLEYPQQEMDGPPFSVVEAEVRRLYEPDIPVTCHFQASVLEENPRFQHKGLTRLEEKVYQLG